MFAFSVVIKGWGIMKGERPRVKHYLSPFLFGAALSAEALSALVGLLLCGSSNGAGICTRTAANALVSVDYVLAITLGNATGGASVSASATADAIIRNLVCHFCIPPN